MKKNIFIWILTVSACLVFADGKKELKKIIANVDTKEFTDANKNIDKLQEQGKQYVSQGKFKKALECYKKALAQANKFYGNGSTASAMIYTCMGSLFLKKKEMLKAADSLMNASEIYKNSMGAMLIPHNYYVLRLHAAGIYCNMKKYTVALNILKELEKKNKHLPQKRRAKVYCLLAECYYSESKFIKAIKYCETAYEEIINDVNTDGLKTKIYDIWAACLASSGKRKEAVNKFQKCMKYAVKAKRPNSFIGDVFLNTGINYMVSEDYSNAKNNFAMALKNYQSIKKDALFWKGKTYLYLARNSRYHNKWKEAENYYEKAAELLEKYLVLLKNNKNNLEQAKKKAFIALCIVYKWLQTCFYQNKTQMKALTIYPRLKKISYINNKSKYLANIYPPLIANYIGLKKYEEAKLIIIEGKKAINLSDEKLSKESNLATLCYLEGKILHLTGHKKLAIEKCERALALLKKIYPNSTKAKLISQRLKEWKK